MTIFSNSLNRSFFSLRGEFVTKYSFFIIFFSKWRNLPPKTTSLANDFCDELASDFFGDEFLPFGQKTKEGKF